MFNENVFYGYLIKGNLCEAINYLKQFPEKTELCNKYISLFERENYLTFEADEYLNKIFVLYQQYYRDVFYLKLKAETAAQKLRNRLTDFFGIEKKDAELGEMEETKIAEAFNQRGFCFLGGRTSGYFGPYIWKTTEEKTYEVELPDGICEYKVKFLDGFISKGWLDYISFGAVGTGGWSDGDGIINCIRASYDVDDERFTVSLLKHEAQHAMDLAMIPDLASAELEYRAKLVELIYSSERNLLTQFGYEADSSNASNGHGVAAERIVSEFEQQSKRGRDAFGELSVEEIQVIARELFRKSNGEIL